MIPSDAPRMTIAVLMYHSGRAASFSHAGQAGQDVADREPGQQGHDVSGLARQAQATRQMPIAARLSGVWAM